MKRTFNLWLLILGVITLTFWSCKKQDQPTDNQDSTSVSDNAQADETFTDVFTSVNAAASEQPNLFSSNDTERANAATAAGTTISTLDLGGVNPHTSTPCASVSVTLTNNTWPKIVTFDFGTGCTNNGVTRSGKIIAAFSGPMTTTNSSLTITFNNYTVNGTIVGGTKVVTNNGPNQTTRNYVFTHVVSNATLVNAATGLNLSWNSTKKFEWTEGMGTSTRLDDVFSITGSASGTNSKGNAFTILITKPFIRQLACRFIVSGTVQTTESTRKFTRVLDYGDEKCDALATITINGVSKPITLRK